MLALSGCASGSGGSGNGDGEPVVITVLAAASLTDTFEQIADDFEASHGGITVRLSFGGSATLAEQILSGAPADVFAAADTVTMAKLGDDAVDPQAFATNTLQIAVPKGNPADISSFEDLAKSSVKVVVCAPEVPCGTATQKVADDVGVTLDPVSYEQSVTDVLGKVASGEADAGVVYRTDVASAGGDVEGVPFPEAASVVNTYPIARIAGTAEDAAAQQFVEYVLSDAGRQVLTGAGFGAP